MIFDRTEQDVIDAVKIREEKVKNGRSLTDGEKQKLERGFCGVDTLNRIEQKQLEIAINLSKAGYKSARVYIKRWNDFNFVFASELKRIADNNRSLRESFYVLSETPENAVGKYHYEDFNKLEKVLNDLEAVYNGMVSLYKECGEAESGD